MYRRKIQIIKRNFDINSEKYLDDEIVIDVLNGDVGVEGVCMLSEFSGLYHAKRTGIRQSSAFQEGSTPGKHSRVEERTVELRLATKAKTAARHEDIETILWHILRMDEDCILRVWTDEKYRELKVRLAETPRDIMQYDPEIYKILVWNVVLVATDPWWYGELITDEWVNTDMTGEGYVVLANPADQPAYVQWASGTVASSGEVWTLPDVGVTYPAGHAQAGQQVMITLPKVNPGDEFLVDTYPLSMPVETLSNVQLAAEMRMKKFRGRIEPGTDYIKLPVQVTSLSNKTRIKAYVQTRWERPYGGEAWTSIAPI